MKFDDNQENVPNQCAKFLNFAPIGSMGCHRLLVLSRIIIIIIILIIIII